jgi:hypothetical protein
LVELMTILETLLFSKPKHFKYKPQKTIIFFISHQNIFSNKKKTLF